MIALSVSALRYAVDVCRECSGYKVGIVPYDAYEMREVVKAVSSILEEKACLEHIRNNGWNYYVEFPNGSILKIIRASNSARGHRFHLVVINKFIDREIRDILKSVELLEWL